MVVLLFYHFRCKLDLGSFDPVFDVFRSECLELAREIETTSSSFNDRDVGDCEGRIPALRIKLVSQIILAFPQVGRDCLQ